jgi:hypothetical protein
MQSPNSGPPARSLTPLRIIWGALIGGQLMFLSMITIGGLHGPGNVDALPTYRTVAWGMLLIFVPVTFAYRLFVFRRFQVDGQIRVPAYSTGNIIFWAGCEGVSFAAMVFGFQTGSLRPFAPIIILALALQALTFPIGGNVSTE